VRLILANHRRSSRALVLGSHAGRRLLLPSLPPPQALLCARTSLIGGGGPYLRIAGYTPPPTASRTEEPATPTPVAEGASPCHARASAVHSAAVATPARAWPVAAQPARPAAVEPARARPEATTSGHQSAAILARW